MKIAQLTASISRKAGGPFVSVRRLSQCLLSLGETVEVLGLEDADTVRDLSQWKPLKPIVSQCRFPRMFGYAPDLLDTIKTDSPDIIHTHGLWMYPSIVALRWTKRIGKPRIVSPRGMLEPWAWRHHWWKKHPIWWAWEKRNLESATVLHATAHEEANNLRALGLVNPIAVIPNGVDVPELHQTDGGDAIHTALFISRIHPKKGLLNRIH